LLTKRKLAHQKLLLVRILVIYLKLISILFKGNFFLAGDSAGGNLAAISAIHLVNKLHVDPPAAILLISPCVNVSKIV
jgi:hypothetical protein